MASEVITGNQKSFETLQIIPKSLNV